MLPKINLHTPWSILLFASMSSSSCCWPVQRHTIDVPIATRFKMSFRRPVTKREQEWRHTTMIFIHVLVYLMKYKLFFAVFVLPSGSCRTRSSTGNCCVFPFIYRGKRYNRCTRVRSKRPWCAITPNYDHDKLYGYCGGRKRKKIITVFFLSLWGKRKTQTNFEYSYSFTQRCVLSEFPHR